MLAVATAAVPFLLVSLVVASDDRPVRVLMLIGCVLAATVLVKVTDSQVMRRRYLLHLFHTREFTAGAAAYGLHPMGGTHRPAEWSSLELLRRPVPSTGHVSAVWSQAGVVHGREVALIGFATIREYATACMGGICRLHHPVGDFRVEPRAQPLRHRDDPPFDKEFKVKGAAADSAVPAELQRWLLDHCRREWRFEVQGSWVACLRACYRDPTVGDIGVMLAAVIGFAERLESHAPESTNR